MTVEQSVRSGFNPDGLAETIESPDESGDSDLTHYNERNLHSSLAKSLISANPEQLPDKALYALHFAPEKSDFTNRVIARLIDIEEYALANQIAACGEWYKSLDCSDCGETNTSEQTCNRPHICADCSSNPGGRAQGEYGSIVTEWSRPTYLGLWIPGTFDDPSVARERALNVLNRFKRRKVSVDREWLDKLAERDKSFADRIRREYVEQGLQVPVKELITGYIGGRHSKYIDGKWRIHLDILANTRYFPLDKLGSLWQSCGGEKSSVQIQRVNNRDGFRTRTSVMKTLAYVTDKVDCDDPEELVDYHLSTNGEKRSLTGGSLHGNGSAETDTVEQRCGHCGSNALRFTGYCSTKPEGSTETELFVNGDRVSKGGKFCILPPD